jgi:hypothetical protein
MEIKTSSYFCVRCRSEACKDDRHIPLVEFRPDINVGLPERFSATHTGRCKMSFRYRYGDVYRTDLGHIADFVAHPDFTQTPR